MVGHGKKRIRFGSRGKKIEDFVDPNKDPGSYLKRYLLEEKYKDWFDRNYPDQTIYDAVGLDEWDYNEMKKKLSPEQDTVEETSESELNLNLNQNVNQNQKMMEKYQASGHLSHLEKKEHDQLNEMRHHQLNLQSLRNKKISSKN